MCCGECSASEGMDDFSLIKTYLAIKEKQVVWFYNLMNRNGNSTL